MIHPKTKLRFINDKIGYGVFATELIPEGTVVYVKDSLELSISPEEYQKHSTEMKNLIEKYSYKDENGNRILSWDFAKYVNHCCQCNTISTGYGFELAIRTIQPGEQITDEYGIFNLDYDMKVHCEHSECRKIVHRDDFDRYYLHWDVLIKKSLGKLFEVKQPLFPFLDSATKKEIYNFFKDPGCYKSVYSLKAKSRSPVKQTREE